MKLNKADVDKIIKKQIIKIDTLGNSKGATLIVFKGYSYYVWKDKDSVYFQGKWFWNKKHMFVIAELAT